MKNLDFNGLPCLMEPSDFADLTGRNEADVLSDIELDNLPFFVTANSHVMVNVLALSRGGA